MSEPIAYRVRASIIVPVLLSIGAIFLTFATSPWAIVAIPFVVLGSICAAPNLNIADGFFALAACIVGLIVSKYHQEIGTSIFLGTFASWFLSSIEKRYRAIPIYEKDSIT